MGNGLIYMTFPSFKITTLLLGLTMKLKERFWKKNLEILLTVFPILQWLKINSDEY